MLVNTAMMKHFNKSESRYFSRYDFKFVTSHF